MSQNIIPYCWSITLCFGVGQQIESATNDVAALRLVSTTVNSLQSATLPTAAAMQPMLRLLAGQREQLKALIGAQHFGELASNVRRTLAMVKAGESRSGEHTTPAHQPAHARQKRPRHDADTPVVANKRGRR